MTETFYDVLGVSPDASSEDIRTAYRRRLKECHPDRNDADDAHEVTKRIVRARDVLTDERERGRYDRMGHEAYVGESSAAVDDGDVSEAADDARETDRMDGDEAETGTDATGPAETGRRRSRDRRRRERAASERVDRERSGDRTTSDRTSGDRSGGSTDGGATASDGVTGDGSVGASSPSWAGDGGFTVRRQYDRDLHPSRLFPVHQSLSLVGLTFLLYPVMVFSAVFPPFPIAINVVVALCTVFLIGYLQSIPEVGVVVFGLWGLVTPVAFVLAGVSLTGLVGVVALTGTWLPFGLSVLTLSLVRP